jgi:hydrogenase large subunit
MAQKMINVPLNRVEGDLEVRVELADGIVQDAWCSGTMYRGFEKILAGRGALDGLVITPRICGICGTSHLTSAARALDMIAGVTLPPDAVRMRNLALMTEHIQSDARHAFLMFAADFTNPAYKKCSLYEQAVQRYAPFQGQTAIETIQQTKKVLEIIAIIGGQWPHSSYMVPGGIASIPSAGDLLQCQLLLQQYRRWYEQRVLGCSLERWREVQNELDLENWLEQNDAQRQSDLGFYVRFAREIGLDKIGRGPGSFISFGAFDLPQGTAVRAPRGSASLAPAGFVQGAEERRFRHEKISEHVAYSWFEDYAGGLHPFEGETQPYATGQESAKYSWAKAPRFDGLPAETGPLAEMLVAGNPLFVDLVGRNGANAYLRELARLVRAAELIPAMETWLAETTGDAQFYAPPGEIIEGHGVGLTQAARGALGHWMRVADGAIEHYQIITPTAWNASPRDSDGVRGPMEEALVGTGVRDESNPVELGHVVRSFDPCLVCTVHTVSQKPGFAAALTNKPGLSV